MIDVRAISIFIVAGGDLVAMRHCRTPDGQGGVAANSAFISPILPSDTLSLCLVYVVDIPVVKATLAPLLSLHAAQLTHFWYIAPSKIVVTFFLTEDRTLIYS